MTTPSQRHRPEPSGSLTGWLWWVAATVAISVPITLLVTHVLETGSPERSAPAPVAATGPSLGAELLEAVAAPAWAALGWASAQADAGRWWLLVLIAVGASVAMTVLSPLLGLLVRTLGERWGR